MKIIWLAGFRDPDEADGFMHKTASKLKRLGLTDKFGVRIRTEYATHNVELVEYDDKDQ